jgi:hypothetical protein
MQEKPEAARASQIDLRTFGARDESSESALLVRSLELSLRAARGQPMMAEDNWVSNLSPSELGSVWPPFADRPLADSVPEERRIGLRRSQALLEKECHASMLHPPPRPGFVRQAFDIGLMNSA